MRQWELRETRTGDRAVTCVWISLSPLFLIRLARQLPSLPSAFLLGAVRSQHGGPRAELAGSGHAARGRGRRPWPSTATGCQAWRQGARGRAVSPKGQPEARSQQQRESRGGPEFKAREGQGSNKRDQSERASSAPPQQVLEIRRRCSHAFPREAMISGLSSRSPGNTMALPGV